MRKFIFILSLFLLFALATEARPINGGVSDGGGGSVGSSAVTPEQIAQAVPPLAHWILPWLYRQQAQFQTLSPADQKDSTVAKLFPAHGDDILVLIPKISFELRLSGPCFDANHTPKEGSIFAKNKNQICLSPFLLSQNLNSSDVAAETAALMIHELSHLLGTNEAEAVAIQKLAIADFSQMSLADTDKALSALLNGEQGGQITTVRGPLQSWSQDPEHFTTARDLLYWNQSWGNLLGSLTDQTDQRVQYVSQSLLDLYPAYNMKIAVLIAYYHAHDMTSTPEDRQSFQDQLDQSFAAAKTLTARQLISAQGGWDPGAAYDKVILHKPESWADEARAMLDLENYLGRIESQVRSLFQFSIPTEITP
jgi:hypothetical protein